MTDRLSSEQVFHDRQAGARSGQWIDAASLRFADDDYLDHESWIRPAFQRLGSLDGLRVLDLGCGHGMAAVVCAHRGAYVTAIDLSRGYLQEARQRAEANGVAVRFVQADAVRLPFADSSFERVWGNAILHHLDVASAAAELKRVLAPGGIAVLSEPWGENPFLEFARRRIRYPGKFRTPDEIPLRRKHLRVLRRFFPVLEMEGFQLLTMARRYFTHRRLLTALEHCDDLLLRCLPFLQQFCRYVVLTLRR